MNVFSFIDLGTNESEFKRLGFTVTIDDPVNNILYCEYKANDYADLLQIIEECIESNLNVGVEINDVFYSDLNEAYNIADTLAAETI